MTLNEYIVENAGRGADESFLRRFNSAEVFFALDSAAIEAPDGPMSASSGTEIKLQIAKLDIGRMGLFYASKDDARLGEKFAGMPLIRAAQMVCDLSSVDGMLLQSDGDAWFVARKEALREVIGQVRDDVFYQGFSKPPTA
jgi:hypothetical protein